MDRTHELTEYQAKQLFARYGLPAPVGYAVLLRAKQKKPLQKSVPVRGSEMSGSRWWPR